MGWVAGAAVHTPVPMPCRGALSGGTSFLLSQTVGARNLRPVGEAPWAALRRGQKRGTAKVRADPLFPWCGGMGHHDPSPECSKEDAADGSSRAPQDGAPLPGCAPEAREEDETLPADIRIIPCLDDNYAVLVHDCATEATAVVDVPDPTPGEGELVVEVGRCGICGITIITG